MTKWSSSALGGTLLAALAMQPAWAGHIAMPNLSSPPIASAKTLVADSPIAPAPSTPPVPVATGSSNDDSIVRSHPDNKPTNPQGGTDVQMPIGENNGRAVSSETPEGATAGNIDWTHLRKADREFVAKALGGGNAEIDEAQLALQKSNNADVKSFAQMMIDDHSKADNQLKTLIAGNIPEGIAAHDHKVIGRLTNLTGKRFDTAYAKSQVHAHKQAVILFKNEAKMGDNEQLRDFASQTLPTLEQHQQAANDLLGKV